MTTMDHRVIRFHERHFTWHHAWYEQVLFIFLALFVIVSPVNASTRFQDRKLYMNSAVPGATTSYTISMRYMTPAAVGSVDMLFCLDPIPYMPCVTPPGLNVSGAVLSSQSGEMGYSISSRSTNHLVLSRTPTVISPGAISSYTFDNVVNPTTTNPAFSIRLKSLASTDGTGPQIDFGSVRGQATDEIVLETQVPPMLIFCLAEQVADNCEGTNDNYYTDMGDLSSTSTLTAQSQMAVGTNASAGFVITANGTPPAAGTSVIDTPAIPTESRPGTNQFGINLVANNVPAVGNDPEGTWANAVPGFGYGEPNKYKYISGDVVAESANVSLMKKFTVSYIMNSRQDLRAGVYTTTITYVASGRF